MSACCVEDCTASPEDNVLHFDFPTSRLLRKRWLDAISSQRKVPNDARVCIRHFAVNEYENIRGKIRLKRKVVPSLFGVNVNNTNESLEAQNNATDGQSDDNVRQSRKRNEQTLALDNKRPKRTRDIEKSDSRKSDSGKSLNNIEYEENSLINNRESGNTNGVSGINNGGDNGESINDSGGEKNNYSIDSGINNNDIIDSGKIKDSGNNINNSGIKNNKERKSINGVETLTNTEPVITNKSKNYGNNKFDKNKRKHMNKVEAEDGLSDCSQVSMITHRSPQHDSLKDDIEDMIKNYQIENKKTERQVAAMSESIVTDATDVLDATDAPVDITDGRDQPPVFIELEVGQDKQGAKNDCLMVLESVQVEVDPSFVLESQQHDPKETPISLLTSSDESDVIPIEPHIDTVEVSDATDEDDMPLKKLQKTKKKKKSKQKNIFTCVQCNYQSKNYNDHKKHVLEHSKVLQMCSDCDFTTSSRSQMYRHRRQHRNEKRYKCNMCNYKARHNMSLIYHMKTHSTELLNCELCSFKCTERSDLDEHVQSCALVICDVDRLNCDMCSYNSKRKSDLKRHKLRVHKV